MDRKDVVIEVANQAMEIFEQTHKKARQKFLVSICEAVRERFGDPRYNPKRIEHKALFDDVQRHLALRSSQRKAVQKVALAAEKNIQGHLIAGHEYFSVRDLSIEAAIADNFSEPYRFNDESHWTMAFMVKRLLRERAQTAPAEPSKGQLEFQL